GNSMPPATTPPPPPRSPIPADDPGRDLAVVRPGSDEKIPHIALASDSYSILLSGEQTNGRYCLIEMRVPPGGGPPPHRHDFEEMFTIGEGQLQFTFRGEEVVAHAGETLNIPANAQHFFRTVSDAPVRMLCMCTLAGQEEYFVQVASPVADPASAPAELTEAEQIQQRTRAVELAPHYRTELL